LKISISKRAYGKLVTVVKGFEDTNIDKKRIAKQLKSKCATGGTVKNCVIELQGNQTRRAKRILEDEGFLVEVE
jgi:translation initiation factor 1